jgi:hypothetical protein
VERQTLVLNEAICLDLVSFPNPVFSMMYQGIAEAISFSSAPSSLNEVLRIYKGNKLECRGGEVCSSRNTLTQTLSFETPVGHIVLNYPHIYLLENMRYILVE